VGSTYRRLARIGKAAGWITVTEDPCRQGLVARVPLTLTPKLMSVVARLRDLLDLDARPDAIASHFASDPLLGRLVRARPGLRVPGAFDRFEVAVRAVLGQEVSVKAASTVAARLVGELGAPFPDPHALARTSVAAVRALGMPERRARAVVELARAVADGRVDLDADHDPERVTRALVALPGIGPWTAQYVAMRALRWPDAFPVSDLVLLRRMNLASPRAAQDRARAWRPWRSYAVMHLWSQS
jgi:AraC family transcriptional regulator of adaptative response / DNA-3-methyladenine glycosylase II